MHEIVSSFWIFWNIKLLNGEGEKERERIRKSHTSVQAYFMRHCRLLWEKAWPLSNKI